MMIDRRTGVRTQLTNGAADSMNASVDDGERIIVFESAADFFATGVGGTQIYRIDLRKTQLGCPFPCAQSGNAGLTQLTNKTGTNHNADHQQQRQGDRLRVRCRPLERRPDRESDLSLRRQDRADLARHPRPGRGAQSRRSPATAADSSSSRTPTSPAPAPAARRSSTTAATRRRCSRLTTAPGGACTNPAVSSNGHAVAFLSSDDLLGLGSDGPELYSYDLKKNYLLAADQCAGLREPHRRTRRASSPSSSPTATSRATAARATQLHLVNLFALGNPDRPVARYRVRGRPRCQVSAAETCCARCRHGDPRRRHPRCSR